MTAEVPDLAGWADMATRRGTDPEAVGAELLDAIREGVEAHPRSAQKEIGPSEVGHPCDRWLGYRLADVKPAVPEPTPWRQNVGTDVHAGTEDKLHRWNEVHSTRYLTDLLVEVGELYPGRPITGHLDVLDLWTATVVDLKVPGPTGMKNYGPGKPENPEYTVQKQLYARGAARAGFPVDRVAILRLPAAGEFDKAVYKHDPYDEQIAVDALARAGGIARLVDTLGAKAAPLLKTADHYCDRCEWFAPKASDLTRSCPGDPNRKTRFGKSRTRRADGLDALTQEENAA